MLVVHPRGLQLVSQGANRTTNPRPILQLRDQPKDGIETSVSQCTSITRQAILSPALLTHYLEDHFA
jgi:hypothetical protein